MILSLETSTPVCSVALHDKGQILGEHRYFTGKSHSSVLPVTIDQLLNNCQVEMSDLEAIAVSGGPGSYTGLRIGTATAKGLCVGLDIPLISVPSLEILLAEALRVYGRDSYYIPMIDARRMEVYQLIANSDGQILEETSAKVISEDSFSGLTDKEIILFGDGASKCLETIKHPAKTLVTIEYPNAGEMGVLAYSRFQKKKLEDLVYFEPDYLKAFQTKKPKNQLIG